MASGSDEHSDMDTGTEDIDLPADNELGVSDDELDSLEVETLYDSDENQEYVPLRLSSSDSNMSDEEEGEASRYKRRRHRQRTRGVPRGASGSRSPIPSRTTTPLSKSRRTTSTVKEEVDEPFDQIVKFSKEFLRGRNGHLWSTKSATRPTAGTPRHNIINIQPGSTASTFRNSTPHRYFEQLFDDAMIDEIVQHTNAMVQVLAQKFAQQKATVNRTTVNEIKALIGCLIYSGAKQDNHVTAAEMFSTQHGPAIYRAAMSERRFTFLLRCLSFDDKNTREERKETDRLAPIRKVWDTFIERCLASYVPSENLTVDE